MGVVSMLKTQKIKKKRRKKKGILWIEFALFCIMSHVKQALTIMQ